MNNNHWKYEPVRHVAKRVEKISPSLLCLSQDAKKTNTGKNKHNFWYIELSSVDIGTGRIIQDRVKRVSAENMPTRARQIVHKDDVIIATTRPYLKRVAIISEEMDGAICSTGFCVLRPVTELIVPRFLFYSVITDSFVQQMVSMQRGAVYPAVTDREVFSCQILLPCPDNPDVSRAIQQQIVTFLDTVNDEIGFMEELINSIERDVSRLKQIALATLFKNCCGNQ